MSTAVIETASISPNGRTSITGNCSTVAANEGRSFALAEARRIADDLGGVVIEETDPTDVPARVKFVVRVGEASCAVVFSNLA